MSVPPGPETLTCRGRCPTTLWDITTSKKRGKGTADLMMPFGNWFFLPRLLHGLHAFCIVFMQAQNRFLLLSWGLITLHIYFIMVRPILGVDRSHKSPWCFYFWSWITWHNVGPLWWSNRDKMDIAALRIKVDLPQNMQFCPVFGHFLTFRNLHRPSMFPQNRRKYAGECSWEK